MLISFDISRHRLFRRLGSQPGEGANQIVAVHIDKLHPYPSITCHPCAHHHHHQYYHRHSSSFFSSLDHFIRCYLRKNKTKSQFMLKTARILRSITLTCE